MCFSNRLRLLSEINRQKGMSHFFQSIPRVCYDRCLLRLKSNVTVNYYQHLKCIRNEIFFPYENIIKTGKNAFDSFLISYLVPEISAFKEV